MAKKTSILPKEMIWSVFSHLPFDDLARAMLVCRLWRDVGEQHARWRDFELVFTEEQNFGEVEEICRSNRFSQVRRLKLKYPPNGAMWRKGGQNKISQLKREKNKKKVFQIIWQHPTIESLELLNYNISCIDREVLSTFPPKLRRLTMIESGFTAEQAQSLFTEMKEQDTLADLQLEGEDLSEVDEDILAAVFNKLESLYLDDCELETEQLEAIFSVMTRKSKLRTCKLTQIDLTEVDAKKLAISVNKLEDLDLEDVTLTKEQIEKVLRQVLVKTCLKRLVIRCEEDEERRGEEIPEKLTIEVAKKLDQFQMHSFM